MFSRQPQTMSLNNLLPNNLSVKMFLVTVFSVVPCKCAIYHGASLQVSNCRKETLQGFLCWIWNVMAVWRCELVGCCVTSTPHFWHATCKDICMYQGDLLCLLRNDQTDLHLCFLVASWSVFCVSVCTSCHQSSLKKTTWRQCCSAWWLTISLSWNPLSSETAQSSSSGR